MQRRGLIIAARTVLVMLAIAAVGMLGVGLVAMIRDDPPELSGWLRSLFGDIFAVFAIASAAMLGVPAALGLWAMAGAGVDDAVPAFSRPARLTLAAIAIGTAVATAIVLIAAGGTAAVIDLALVALVAMGTLGLAGATSFSPHRGRAIGSAVALILVSLGIAWMLQALLAVQGRSEQHWPSPHDRTTRWRPSTASRGRGPGTDRGYRS